MPATSDSKIFAELCATHPKAKRVLAEGDSWFAYPRQFLVAGEPANIVDQLARKPDLVIHSTARNGDEILSMLSGEQKFALLKRLGDRSRRYDYLLFSGGGNDIVGRYDFGFLLRKKREGEMAPGWVDSARLTIKLNQIVLMYEELIHRVLDLAPQTKVVAHTYDFPIPAAFGSEPFDKIPLGRSWMYPYLHERGIDDPGDQQAIAKYIMLSFFSALHPLTAKYPQFVLVNTQGSLGSQHWRNEIHPTPAGFGILAEKIYAALQA